MSSPCRQYPGLLYTKRRVDELGRRIKERAVFQGAWQRIIERAESLLEDDFIPEEKADEPDNQHGDYARPGNQIGRMSLTLGLVYQITGDDRYAEKLRSALLYYSQYRKWYGRGLMRLDPPWHSELNTARFCFGFAVGYDCIHDYLTENDGKTVVDAVTRLGILPTLEDWILPEKRVHALDSMGHNWWSVCVAEAGLAALSIMDDDLRATGWVDSVVDAFPQWFEYKGERMLNKSPNFDEGGAFYESVNYANYALYEYLLFRLGLTNVVGKPEDGDIPLLPRIGEYFLHTCYPTGSEILTVNFGDGYVRGNAVQAAKMLLANGFTGKGLRAYVRKARADLDELDLLYYDEVHEGDDELRLEETSVVYPAIGWATMRDSWEDDRTLVAVKSGFTWNHAHADAGSFIVFHRGFPLITDSGNCSYSRPEYGQYYCMSHAHNVVLFDGQGQGREDLGRGVKHPGAVDHLIDLGDLRCVQVDATGPMSRYLSRNYRHLLWFDDTMLVIDEVRSHEPGTYQWLLHYDGEASIDGDIVTIQNGAASALVQNHFPGDLALDVLEGLRDHRPDEKVSYLQWATSEPAREAKLITSITLSGERGGAAITRIEGPEMVGVRVKGCSATTDVYLNLRADGRKMHRNSNSVLNGFETDAYLLAVTWANTEETPTAANLSRCLVAGGSYLRKDGRVLYDSLSKAYVGFARPNGEPMISISGQPLIKARIQAEWNPRVIRLNGHVLDANTAHLCGQSGWILISLESRSGAARLRASTV